MKTKQLFWGIIILIGLASIAVLGSFQNIPDRTMSETISTILKTHVDPQELTDDYSKRVFALFIKRLDPGKRLFTKMDMERLRAYELELDDAVAENNTQLAELAHDILTSRVKEAQQIVSATMQVTQNFTTQDTLETNYDKRTPPDSDTSFRKEWQTFAKHHVLTNAMMAIDAIPSGNPIPSVDDPKIELDARQKAQTQLNDYFKRLQGETLTKRIQVLIDCMAAAFDPHTGYMAPEERNEFDISIKGSLEGIGAVLQEDNGFIKINRIVPGSPAARSRQLNAQDIILKVTQSDGSTVDLVGATVGDAVKVIRGKKGTEVRLTIKSPDGKVSVLNLIRDVIELEESHAKSAIMTNKDSQPVGYIYLPSFYRDFNDSNAKNAADDIKTILVAFESKGIQSVILDLRNNGGGALDDAVKVTGLLIDSGPVVQVRDRFNRRFSYSDFDSGVVFSGNVVVLVNAFSASASEIVAGALQDYGRAVIVGGQHTYGKGTVQQLLTLSGEGMGSIKVTNQKYYRITGASTQFRGVIPDIILPQTEDYLDVGEDQLPYALGWTSTLSQPFIKWQHPSNLGSLQELSKSRIRQSSAFGVLSDYLTRYRQNRKQTVSYLNAEKAIMQQKQVKRDARLLDQFKVTSSQVTASFFHPQSTDIDRKKDQDNWANSLVSDPYVIEAISVLGDMASPSTVVKRGEVRQK